RARHPGRIGFSRGTAIARAAVADHPLGRSLRDPRVHTRGDPPSRGAPSAHAPASNSRGARSGVSRAGGVLRMSVDALVTGGTGFVGANLVRELLADGARVRVLARRGSDRRALEGCEVDVVEGDLLEPASLRAAVAGATRVYHVAADYRLWAPDIRA